MKFLKTFFSILALSVSLDALAETSPAPVWLNDDIATNIVQSINSKLIPFKCASPEGNFSAYYSDENTLLSVSKSYDYGDSKCQRTDLNSPYLHYSIVPLQIGVSRGTYMTTMAAHILLPLDYFPSQETLSAFLTDIADKNEDEVFKNFDRAGLTVSGTAEKGTIVIHYSRPSVIGDLILQYEIKPDAVAPKDPHKKMDIKISVNFDA